ncbi:hypothetical protein IKL64_06355 [bacterium]|nr:hypothetical protein [bacterium]
MSGLNLIERAIAKPLKWFSGSKVARNAGNQVFNNNRAYIDGLGVASIIAKDGLGCYLYVTQSLNNKDIPDDKRSFVASLDLTNGVLMIALQLLMFFTVSHKVCQTKMFDKFFGKMFDRPIKKAYQALAKNEPRFAGLEDIKFEKEFTKIRNNVKDAFGGVTSLVAASIIGKRVLVPFIATPLAGTVEKKMKEKMDAKKGIKPENDANKDNSQPSMQGGMKDAPAASTQPALVAPQFDTGSTNLLDKYRKQQQ